MTSFAEPISLLLLGAGLLLLIGLCLLEWFLALRSPLAAFVLAGSMSVLAVFTSYWPLAFSLILFAIFQFAARKRGKLSMQAAALRNMRAKDLGL